MERWVLGCRAEPERRPAFKHSVPLRIRPWKTFPRLNNESTYSVQSCGCSSSSSSSSAGSSGPVLKTETQQIGTALVNSAARQDGTMLITVPSVSQSVSKTITESVRRLVRKTTKRQGEASRFVCGWSEQNTTSSTRMNSNRILFIRAGWCWLKRKYNILDETDVEMSVDLYW